MATSAAAMDSTTLADFDFSSAQQTRTQTLIDNGTLELQRVLTGPAISGTTSYRHMGWPVATRLPDGRTVVLIRNLRDHSAYASYPDNARRVIWSDDNMATWLPADVLSAPPPFGSNLDETPTKYDYQGMHAISWATPTGTAATGPRLVAVTAQQDANDKTPRSRVYLSDDRGATWREQANALSAMPSGAVHSGPNMVRHPEFGLVVPFGQQTGSGTNRQNYIASSTDAGETWQIRTWTNSAASRSIEPALATWGDGHMVLIGRERDDTYGYDSVSGKYYYTQHVYKHIPGAAFSSVSFTTARTNVAGNGATPIAKGKNGYEAHDTAEVIYNPVTGRIEMIQSSRWGNGAENPLPADPSNVDTVNNSLNIWSIDPVDLLNGGTTWRFDGNLIERQGIILGGATGTFGAKGNKDGYHPGGSIVDEAAGKQHIFIYVGVYTAYANAYRISRPLDTYAFRAACGLPALPKPAITAIADVDANNHVTITGTNFADLKEVLVAGKPATIASATATEIKFPLPTSVTAGDQVIVRTDNGLAKGTVSFTHIVPVVTSIAYEIIWPGKTVTITGSNLAGVNKVLFGAVEVTSFVSKTDTQIVVIVPGGVTDGIISVQAPGGAATAPDGGDYIAAARPFNLAPLIPAQPVVIGLHPLDITASAEGTPAPSFKWQYRSGATGDWIDLAPSSDYQGTGSDHLTIINTAGKNGWQYRYVAMNQTEDVYSDPVTLQLLAEALPAPSGIVAASDSAAPDLYVADIQTHAIYVVTQSDKKVLPFAGQPGKSGSEDGDSATARFNTPRGLSLTPDGNLLVADTGNSLIRLVAADGSVATLPHTFNKPRGVVAHDDGSIYVADTGNHLIKKISASGSMSIIAGAGAAGFANGIGPEAQFNTPSGITLDLAGNLYIADTGNHAIRYIDMVTGSVSTLAGTGTAGTSDGPVVQTGTRGPAVLRAPESVAVDNITDRVYVADTGNHRIRVIYSGSVFSVAGQLPGIAGFKDDIVSENLTVSDGWLDTPSAIAAGGTRTFYIADTGNAVIRRYSAAAVTGEITTLPVEAITGNPTLPDNNGSGGSGGGGGASGWWFFAALAVLLTARALAGKPRQ